MFVYFSLPTLKNLPGKIVLSNVTSILLTTKLLIIIYNVQKKQDQFEGQETLAEGEFLILGGFQLEFVSISRVISHMTFYQFECSHWWKIYLKNILYKICSPV